MSKIWAEDWISSIEDVTDRALELKEAILRGETLEQVIKDGWMPYERVYAVDEELKAVLKMELC